MTVPDSVRNASLYHGSDGADTVKHDRVITGSGVTTAGGRACQVSIAARILSPYRSVRFSHKLRHYNRRAC